MRHSRLLSYTWGALFGVAFVGWLLPLAAYVPPDALHAAAIGDRAQSVIGQRYFLGEPWGWPLLLAPRLDWPRGVSVALTDSIPLLIVPLKLFRAWLPPGTYIQDGWLGLAWLLQPVAAVFALRGAGERRLMPAVFAAVLSLSLPSLLGRYGQMSLCTHAVILAALGLYFRLVRAAGRGPWLGATLLLPLASLVHPYLAAMAAGILAGAPLSLLLRRDRRWLRTAAALAIGVALSGGLAAIMGLAGSARPVGFGFFSMNLLAPVVPWRSSLFGDHTFDPTGGQWFEGGQYLGLGVIVLALAALGLLATGRVRLRWRGHAGLLAVVGLMALFALSDKVYAGNRLLLTVKHVPGFIQQFRATGRFFWPASYGIIIGSVAVVARGLRAPWAAAVLLLGTGLQWADTAKLRNDAANFARHRWAWEIDVAALSPLLASHDLLTVWPTYGCGAQIEPDATFLQLLLLGSETLIRTNTMYTARATEEDEPCDARRTLGPALQPHELRVILPYGDAAGRWMVPDGDRLCHPVAGMTVCAADLPPAAAPAAPPGFPLGHTMEAGVDDPSWALVAGWSVRTSQGVWSDGPAATLGVRLAPGEHRRLALRMVARGFAPTARGTQTVRAYVGGQLVATWELPDLVEQELHADLPAPDTDPLLLRFEVAQPTRPADRGMNLDLRRLGLELRSFSLQPIAGD